MASRQSELWTEERVLEHQAKMRSYGLELKGTVLNDSVPATGTQQPEAGTIESLIEESCKSADDGLECELQDKIEDWCTEHGYHFFHDRSRKKNVPGQPDIVIALRGGVTLWLELKSRGGRLSAEQRQTGMKLLACGHRFEVVRSFRRFLQIANEVLAAHSLQ